MCTPCTRNSAQTTCKSRATAAQGKIPRSSLRGALPALAGPRPLIGRGDVSLLEPQPTLPSTEILLVDDDPKTLLAMEAMLADLGGCPVNAHNGRDALL